MREILFKAKRTNSSKWVYGMPCATEQSGIYAIQTMQGEIFYIAPETVGQYTGLTDKKGKKVFVGDIIKVDNGRLQTIFVVKYGFFRPNLIIDALEDYMGRKRKESFYGLYVEATKTHNQAMLTDNIRFIEVIGNIYDNPELLKGGADDE